MLYAAAGGADTWGSLATFQRCCARYTSAKSAWLQRSDRGQYQLRVTTGKQLHRVDGPRVEAAKAAFDACPAVEGPLTCPMVELKNYINFAALDAFQPVNGAWRKDMEAEAYTSRPGFTQGLVAQQCGKPGCAGCSAGGRIGDDLAGLFVPSPTCAAGAVPAEPLTKRVLRKVSIADVCSGMVEFTFERAGWGPRACVLHRWGARLGHKRTREWLVAKGDDYRLLMVWVIKGMRRVYGK